MDSAVKELVDLLPTGRRAKAAALVRDNLLNPRFAALQEAWVLDAGLTAEPFGVFGKYVDWLAAILKAVPQGRQYVILEQLSLLSEIQCEGSDRELMLVAYLVRHPEDGGDPFWAKRTSGSSARILANRPTWTAVVATARSLRTRWADSVGRMRVFDPVPDLELHRLELSVDRLDRIMAGDLSQAASDVCVLRESVPVECMESLRKAPDWRPYEEVLSVALGVPPPE